MKFSNAIVKIPADTFAQGLTSALYGIPEYKKTLFQHEKYCAALKQYRLEVNVLDPDPLYPDSTFLEDVAVIGKEFVVITNPGADSRKGEVPSVSSALKEYDSIRRTYAITSPGTLDGGDICDADGHFFIGISHRTNEEGGRQLSEFLKKEDCTSTFVDVRKSKTLLHLKSGIAYLDRKHIVLVDELVGLKEFEDYNIIRTRPEEEYAANCVLVNDFVLVADGYPHFHSSLKELGYKLIVLDMSEFRKMDGGLSCLSLRF